MKKNILSISLFFILAFSVIVNAADIELKAIGGKVSIVLPEDPMDSTIGLGLLADIGTIIPQLRAEANLDYWGNSYDTLGVESSWTSIAIGGTARYYLSMDSKISPFAGGGMSFIISRAKTEFPENIFGVNEDTSDTDTDLGFHIVGGVDIPITDDMNGRAEGKYAIDGADSFQIGVGIIFKLK